MQRVVPRIVRGWRGWVILIGICSVVAGAIFAVGYDVLSEPDMDSRALDPAFDHLTYPMPRWLLLVGGALVVVGIAVVVTAWLLSPRWAEGAGPTGPDDFRPATLALVGTALTATAVVVITGRGSPFLWTVLLIVALCIAIVALMIRKQQSSL